MSEPGFDPAGVAADDSWLAQAGIRTFRPDFESAALTPEVPDFPASVLPAEAAHLPQALRLMVLSALWVSYNDAVVSVEANVVVPSCEAALELSQAQLKRSPDVALLAREAEVDEHFHILMSQKAAEVSRAIRGLRDLELPPYWLAAELSAAETPLVRLAHGYAIEATINFSLFALSRELSIQPSNRAWVRAHWNDERRHSRAFRRICRDVYQTLGHSDRARFISGVDYALGRLMAPRHEAWSAITSQLGVGTLPAPPSLIFASARLERARSALRDALLHDPSARRKRPVAKGSAEAP